MKEFISSMEEFKKEDLEKLKLLCRIECTEEEDEKLLKNLKSIFQHIMMLQKAQTEGILGKHNLLECQSNVMAEDTVGQTLSTEEFLKNAPDHVGGMIKAPTVIQFE